MSSKSKASEPSVPLISMRIAFLRPSANRVASKDPIAPPSKRAVNRAASSTVTGPRSPVASPTPPSPDAWPATGRLVTKVSSSPDTPVIDWPVIHCVASITCAPVSPSAPDPASDLSIRQVSGTSASASQSCRYCARTCRMVPRRPSATSSRASDSAGTRR